MREAAGQLRLTHGESRDRPDGSGVNGSGLPVTYLPVRYVIFCYACGCVLLEWRSCYDMTVGMGWIPFSGPAPAEPQCCERKDPKILPLQEAA